MEAWRGKKRSKAAIYWAFDRALQTRDLSDLTIVIQHAARDGRRVMPTASPDLTRHQAMQRVIATPNGNKLYHEAKHRLGAGRSRLVRRVRLAGWRRRAINLLAPARSCPV